MAFTLDATFGTLIDHPQAKVILEKYLPGIGTNSMVAMARGMTLNTILMMPQATQLGITKEKVEMVLAEINKVVK